MLRYILTIKLLSDMCCGTGEGDGIRQDISSTYDKNGFPIIYGRRLKGLLRDKVEFMQEKGYIEKGMSEKIFGTGYFKGNVRVGNAQLSNINELKEELECLTDEQRKIINPTSIEEIYTVNRYSTAIENGIAKEHSLRIVGMFPKGIEFKAVIEMDFSKGSDEFTVIADACKLLRNMGVGRNRGYGEVRCELLEDEQNEKYENVRVTDQDIDTISYVIENEDNIILQNSYIPGSALQGYFANQIAKGNYGISVEALLDNVQFDMAYPTNSMVEETYPMPLGMVAEKGNPDKLFSLADGYKIKEGVQYVRTSGYYRKNDNKTISKPDIDTRVNYHFLKKQKLLYTIKCMGKGHYFFGHIHADKAYIKVLVDIINANKGIIYLGGSTNAEHGKCRINIQSFDKRKENETNSSVKKAVFELLSDAILIDDFACNRSDINELKNEVSKIATFKPKDFKIVTCKSEDSKIVTYKPEDSEIIACKPEDIKELYTDTLEIGGYNKKWGMPRQNYIAFAKGTQLVIEAEQIKLSEGYIGILNNEGYGRYIVREVRVDEVEFDKETETVTKENTENKRISQGGIRHKVLLKSIIKEGEGFAISSAEGYLKENKNLSASGAMRLNVAYKACETEKQFFEEFKRYIALNFKGDSNAAIYEFANNAVEKFEEFENKVIYEDILEECKEVIFKAYIRKYIFATKMYFREKEV